jgi:hypothetical protein
MPIPSVGSTQPVRDAFQALDLLAPAIAAAANGLYFATVALGAPAGRFRPRVFANVT